MRSWARPHSDCSWPFRRTPSPSGVTGTNIGGVYNIFSGNNKATINYERNGRYESSTLGYWQGVGFSGTVRVYEVRIW
ncbi:beta/gamma crystallin domain-containing protein [Amycolatopsis coloradensis]|uniref:beta/gamma crystallin domain-containing protein n=1 Tax=Amycolatopsis coloradensis TaxID=76021 RepID=UPI001FC92970|nr:beta/gamma crystallin domain-containing protein [Amycolatopsis coloradensis]